MGIAGPCGSIANTAMCVKNWSCSACGWHAEAGAGRGKRIADPSVIQGYKKPEKKIISSSRAGSNVI
jgi:hypothetical protein